MLYFSYGSNMSSRRLTQRVPSAQVVSVATLSMHRLEFHKVSKDGSAKCDAFETGNQNDYVIGVVFDIHHAEKIHLDKAEGLGFGYDIKQVIIETQQGRLLEAFTYYAMTIDSQLQPYHWYKNHVLIGAREHELPTHYIERIDLVEAIEDIDHERTTQELAIHR